MLFGDEKKARGARGPGGVRKRTWERGVSGPLGLLLGALGKRPGPPLTISPSERPIEPRDSFPRRRTTETGNRTQQPHAQLRSCVSRNVPATLLDASVLRLHCPRSFHHRSQGQSGPAAFARLRGPSLYFLFSFLFLLFFHTYRPRDRTRSQLVRNQLETVTNFIPIRFFLLPRGGSVVFVKKKGFKVFYENLCLEYVRTSTTIIFRKNVRMCVCVWDPKNLNSYSLGTACVTKPAFVIKLTFVDGSIWYV